MAPRELHPVPKPRRRIERGFRAWLRSQPCCIPGCQRSGRTHAAHVRSRGAGGADPNNLVPLCARHHAEQHARGMVTFQARAHVNLAGEARKYWRAWCVLRSRAHARTRFAF